MGMSLSSGTAPVPKLQLHCGKTHVPDLPVSRMLKWYLWRRFVGEGRGGGGGGGEAMLPWLVPLPATERLFVVFFGHCAADLQPFQFNVAGR